MPNYTSNLNLKKPLGTEHYNVADQNENMDIIDQELGELKTNVENIDITTGMEEVINRRVNSDKTKTLSTIIADSIATINSHVTNIRDAITAHVTSQHTVTKSHVSLEKTNIVTAVNIARDNINATIGNGAAKYYTPSDTVKHTYISSPLQSKGVFTKLASFKCVHDGSITLEIAYTADIKNNNLTVYINGQSYGYTHAEPIQNNPNTTSVTKLFNDPVGTVYSGVYMALQQNRQLVMTLFTDVANVRCVAYFNMPVKKGDKITFIGTSNTTAVATFDYVRICYDEEVE